MRPTLYELGSALYGKAPSGENYRDLREALVRLAMVRITIDGYDVETGEFRDNWLVTESPAGTNLSVPRDRRGPAPGGQPRLPDGHAA
ncbi:MAG: hypothetical protein ACR2NB_15720 [Solirubrobacteraceae bacterium]